MKRIAMAMLGLAAVAFFGGALALRRDVRRRGLEVLPADMVRSAALESGGLTDRFADGLVRRYPPAGTVPWRSDAAELVAGPDGAAAAGRDLVNPLPPSPPVSARGAFVFRTWCACCHGVAGAGAGPVTRRGFPPPPPLSRPEAKALKDGELFHLVTFGRKDMPPHGSLLDPDDRWSVVRHVRSLQERAP